MTSFLRVVRRQGNRAECIVNIDCIAKITPQPVVGTPMVKITYRDGTEDLWSIAEEELMKVLTVIGGGNVATIAFAQRSDATPV